MVKTYIRTMMLVAVALLFAEASAQAESSVWVVKGPKATVYLAGSCHVLRAADHPLPPEFNAAYARSKRVVFEAPLEDMKKPAFAQKLAAAALYPDGSTLKGHLSPAVWNKVEQFCADNEYDCAKYYMYRPWMFSTILTLQALERIGVKQGYGVDEVFFNKAKKDKKSLGALETVDEQIQYMAMLDGDLADMQIAQTVDELKDIDMQTEDIVKAWRAGNEAGIEAFSRRELRDYPQLYQALLVDRNKKWIKTIEREIQGKMDTMIIMGVAHLGGSDSVVSLLQKRGYKAVKLHLK